MRNLNVSIEINGIQHNVGTITGDSSHNARFRYARSYIEENFPAISISLPISDEAYSPEVTRNFFEGLLPEGFARRSVANWLHADEDEYLSILEILGSECLGAIRISVDSPCTDSPYMDSACTESYYEELSIDDVKALASEGISKSTELITEAHLSLTGASGKIGLYYDSDSNKWFKPLGCAASTHIVKQSHVRLSGIVTNEQLCMLTASRLGINIPESFIINTGNYNDQGILFATKRYDRLINENSPYIDNMRSPFRLHQEDFSQALGIPAVEKYETADRKYIPEIFRLVRAYSSNPIEDQLKLWDILIYDFLVGNTDNHIKNLSLLYSPDLRRTRLAPAYDIISTAIYRESSRHMAIGIGGERHLDAISRQHFISAAASVGISRKLAMSHFDDMAASFERALEESSRELAEQGYENAEDIRNRILSLGGYSRL